MSEAIRRGAAVVSFALSDESRLFTAGLRDRRVVREPAWRALPLVAGRWEGRPISVIHTGVGHAPATRERFTRLLAGRQPPPSVVVSAGYAGGLHPDLSVGDLVLGENHSSPALLERARSVLAGQKLRVGKLLTVPEAAESASQKKTLHRETGALAVDMETAWIAAACTAAGLPLLSLRVVSDAADQDFPVPSQVLYDAARQRPRYLALPGWLALHPGRITPFARFVRGLGPARERLTHALRLVLAGW